MSKELYCYDCNRAANTECVEQKHSLSMLTAEDVLLELRALFGHGVYIMVEDRRIQYPEEIERDPLRMARIHINRCEFWANTLEATMQKVREWHGTHAEKEI